MENPIKAIRKELKMERKELACILGVSYSAVNQVENDLAGKPYDSILDGLEELGYDRTEIMRKWKEYQQAKKQQLLKKVQ